MIPYGRHDIDDADIEAVISVLKSDYLTQGPVVPDFEQAVAGRVGARHAVAANSATSALHLACLALDVGPGDLVWTSPITFVASANCARFCGADVDFVDIDGRTFNVSVSALEQKLLAAERAGRLPKVVIPVAMCGQSCEMEAIHRLATRHGIRIIEDASHGVGGYYQGQPVGNCQYSDITVFSFHPVKIVTTAEGGMALTNDPRLGRRMAQLRTHGITRDASEMVHRPHGPWYYEQVDLGYNYRMTDLQAALGLSQLTRLDAFVARRQAVARQYDSSFLGLPVVTPWCHPEVSSAYHLYVIRLDPSQCRRSHPEVFASLRQAGIGVNLHYIPVYRQPYYERLGFVPGYCPSAEAYYREAISLPMYPSLSDAQVQEVVTAVAAAVGEVVR